MAAPAPANSANGVSLDQSQMRDRPLYPLERIQDESGEKASPRMPWSSLTNRFTGVR